MRTDVLVVDDDPDIRATLAELLRDEGYSVAELSNGKTLLDSMQQLAPRLVLLDLTMPGFKADEVLADVRAAGLLDKSTVLALSGLEETSQVAQRLGLHGAVRKPFDIDELLEKVAATCGRPGAEGERPAPLP